MYYKPVKIIIDAPNLTKVIINVIMQYHGLLNLIITNQSSVFTLKFLLSLYYLFSIKQKLLTALYLQTKSQNKR